VGASVQWGSVLVCFLCTLLPYLIIHARSTVRERAFVVYDADISHPSYPNTVAGAPAPSALWRRAAPGARARRCMPAATAALTCLRAGAGWQAPVIPFVLFFVTVRMWPAPLPPASSAPVLPHALTLASRSPVRESASGQRAAAAVQAVFGEFYLARRMHSSLTSLLSAFVFLVVDSLLSYWVTLLFTEVRPRRRLPRQPAGGVRAGCPGRRPPCACMLGLRVCAASAAAPRRRGGVRPPCAPAERGRLGRNRAARLSGRGARRF